MPVEVFSGHTVTRVSGMHAMNRKNDIDNAALLQRYVAICNAAIKANRERFPYKQVITAAQAHKQGQAVDVSIVDDRPTPNYSLIVEKDEIMARRHREMAGEGAGITWRVCRTYLEAVVRDPEAYINNPAKIDWEWMLFITSQAQDEQDEQDVD